MSILNLINQANSGMIPHYYKEMSEGEMVTRILRIKQKFGEKLFIPGHHYQKDEVIQFADATGDSLQLAQIAQANKRAQYIVFCGVHFMAETADMLTNKEQVVVLPDMRAGCSMADMANMQQTNRAWDKLTKIYGDTMIPLTYVNSTAEIKAFTGRNGGATVTSSNASRILTWALTKKERILFLPDQHLGRNTAYDLGIPLSQMAVWDPIAEELIYEGDIQDVKIILWKGHCSVHEKFTVDNVRNIKERDPEINVIVHPECSHEVVMLSDYNGSTKKIVDTINKAEPNSKWAIGTEMNLVKRIIKDHPDKQIESLNPDMCPCLTMNRIDLPHLLWSLEEIEKGQPTGMIRVDKEITLDAVSALNRMLNIS
ncbi:quinolinate synthase NadA [Bacillus sp. WMMC1349]|uniref:quinolinate synthase NadA n=1 Tax=Bacillus sp. WMMC1349 TaxID=2736254 RepID=UPI00155830DD|nr:quinolinate synthase NadA [Bacillus sp. WMMC1349]NPC93529.1 quinolinate synthase NadA [Bacillus sp. WMMC1349]